MPGYLTMPGPSPSRPGRAGKDGGGEASVFSSIVNILNTILGAGILSMPLVASHMGIIPAVVVIVWCGLASSFGLYLQSRCARYLDRGSSSFFALAQLTCPQASILLEGAIVVKCFGVGVSYLIIIGDLMPGVVAGLNPALAEVPFLVNRGFWITAFMLPVMVLSFLRKLDSLRHTSMVALLSIGYLVVLVIYYFAGSELRPDRGEIRVITWAGPLAALGSFPVVVFAYTCHQNMFSVLNEIKYNSPSNIMAVIGTSAGSACGLYIVVAITGYLTFGNSVLGNIVMQYPPGLASTIGKASIVVLEMFSVPLQVHPCRASLDAIMRWRPTKPSADRIRSVSPGGRLLGGGGRSAAAASSSATTSVSSSASASASLAASLAANPPRADHGGPLAISEIRFTILTTIILVASYATALSVKNLDTVLAVVGSTGSTAISFILPGFFYWRISDPDSIHHQRLLKDNDDVVNVNVNATGDAAADADDEDRDGASAAAESDDSSAALIGPARWHRALRLDLEHMEPRLLRKMALGLMCYGVTVCVVCLVARFVFSVGTH